VKSRRLVALGTAACAALAYAIIAHHLPEPTAPAPAPARTTAGATAADADADPAADVPVAAHEDHAGAHGEACGLDAKAMLARFQAAVQERGAVHATALYDPSRGGAGALTIADQVVVGLEADLDLAAIEALAGRAGLRVVRVEAGSGLAVLALALDDAGDVEAALAALAAEPGVRYAEPNYAARVALTPNDPFFPLMTGRQSAGIEQAWDLTTGDPGVLVAVLDTGVDPNHPDLANQLQGGFDFVNQTATLTDDNGHGTAMAGIVAAEGDNGAGVVGVAFGSRILPVKVADAQGVASVADVAAGIDYAIQQGARVINLSLGVRIGSQALEDAVNRALNAGVVVVAAAGNDPVHRESYPAAYPGVVSATVLGPQGDLGFESVLAPGVDVGCPGEEVLTTLPGDVYGFVSGSSAAAAYASGVAALCASRAPGLSGDEVAHVVRQGRDPVPALAGLEPIYGFGRLNALKAVERADPTWVDAAITDLRVYPAKPIAGQPATAIAELTNEGNTVLNNLPVRVQRVQQGSTARIEIGFQVVSGVQPGETREVTLNFTAPAAANYTFSGIASTAPGETELADNSLDRPVTVDANQEPDLRVVARRISDPDLAGATVTCFVTVENRGTAPAQNVRVEGRVEEVLPAHQLGGAAAPSASLGARLLATLDVGQRRTVSFVYAIPNPAPQGILRFEGRAVPLAGEVNTADNATWHDFLLGTAGALRGLYQQSNGVDVIPDAPWRVAPRRPFLPVQVFVPSKGGRTPATKLRLTRTTVEVRDAPTGPGTLVYEDGHGAPPTTSPPGLEVVDELGQPRAGPAAHDLLGDDELDMNGRHDVLRFPRSALGVAAAPTAPEVKYVDVKVEWEQRRPLFFGLFSRTRSGSHRSVLETTFAPEDLPTLPGDNHYHDVHHHTIAEWYFGSPLDIFAPRKAYGGPLQMVFDSAYAMGVIDSPDAPGAWGRIITTDHSSFNNRTIPDPDGPDHRPPFGPQAPSQHAPGTTQLEAYRAVLGPTAGEEVAFKQDIPLPKVHPLVNNLLNMLPGLPLGAHMLLYGADHVEGPWHGGGWLKGPGNPNIDVELFPLLNDVAKSRQAAQGDAFAFCAHPFSGQGWRDGNLERAFGLTPQHRDEDAVHDASGEFVLKGVEFFNGRGTRSLPTSQIDFNDLNPWADPVFQQGVQDWDAALWDGMTRWHRMLADTLEYSFVSDPDRRFVRKVYQAGGSDAHGDFNFSVGRAATPLNLQMTFNVGDEAYYGVRTYCFGDGKPGGSPEARWLEAYRDGNSVTTDGPLATLSLDADGRFDAADLRWHDQASAWEDADGRIGGEGPLDGGRTALVARGSEAPVFRYRYDSSAEFGPVASVLLYKTEAGAPNPTRSRGGHEQIVGVNRMALAGPGAWHEQPLDPAREGPVTKPTAFALGAYTGADPDQRDLGPDAYRCWTNPVFCVPYDVDVDVTATDPATGTIPAGALEVTWTFDVSMEPAAYAVRVKALDQNGESTGRTDPAITDLVPQGRAGGWSDRAGVESSVLTLTNQDPIPLGGDAYPAADRVSFVVYWADAPRDAAGNALNPIATTFEEARVGGAGAGTTAPGATSGGGVTPAVTGGGSSGGGSCALADDPASPPGPAAALLALLVVLGLARRRR